jgi:ParB family chromosome partitioning protein
MDDLVFFRDSHVRLAQADVLIELAAAVKDWQLLEDAVDAKIGEQKALVDWWDAHVRAAGRQPKNADHALISRPTAEERSGFRQDQVSRWRSRLSDTDKYRAQQILAALRKAGIEPPENHRAEGTGDNEWYTPPLYIERARRVMGGIDLDPASNAIAQQWIQAERFFTPAENGLAQEWHGRVWLNPPYSQPAIGHFIDKLVAEHSVRHVDQAILLTHNYTDTGWFHAALGDADLVCLTKGRIRFVDAEGAECSPTQGQAFFYFGSHREAFAAAFGPIGAVLAVSC